MARHLNHLAPPPPLLTRIGAPSLASATTSSGSPATTPLSLSSIPLLPAAPLGAPTLTLPASALLPTSSLPSTVWCSYQSQPLPPASAPTTPPFQLASSFAPIPGKLTRRIQALEFVEMRELLPDSLVLAERLETLPARLTPAKSPEQREVGSLLTWVSSFATYIAVVAQAHPDRVADMLAYMRLIIREARKYGGNGWLTYDMVFRRNHEKKSVPWNYIDPSLHTAYIGGRASLPSLPVAIATRWITVVRIVPSPLPWPPRKPPRSGNQIDHSPSGVVSALFLHFRAPQVRLKRESVSPGIKGNVPSPGHAHTNTSVHHVKPVTRPKTALLPPQTQPSSS